MIARHPLKSRWVWSAVACGLVGRFIPDTFWCPLFAMTIVLSYIGGCLARHDEIAQMKGAVPPLVLTDEDRELLK